MVGEGEEDFGQAKKTNLIGTACMLGGRFVKVCGGLVKWLQVRARRPKTWLCVLSFLVCPWVSPWPSLGHEGIWQDG